MARAMDVLLQVMHGCQSTSTSTMSKCSAKTVSLRHIEMQTVARPPPPPPPSNILVKIWDVNCAEFSAFDRFCSQNVCKQCLQTASASTSSPRRWGTMGLRHWGLESPITPSESSLHRHYRYQAATRHKTR